MMKTKFFVIFAAFLFAAITAYNFQLAQTQILGDISLADITVMAQADGENPPTHDCSSGPKECVRVYVGNEVHIFYEPNGV